MRQPLSVPKDAHCRASHFICKHDVFLLLLALTLGLAGASCQSGKKNAADQSAGGNPSSSGRSAQQIWDQDCSHCHMMEKLMGKTEKDIKDAIARVSVMGNYNQVLTGGDIKALAAFLSASDAKPSSGQGDGYEFIAAETCGACHDSHFSQWKNSMHALAHTEAVYDSYFMKASRDSGKKLETFCANCHTPIGVMNGEIPFQKELRGPGDTRVSEIASDGLQCDFCHIVNGRKDGAPGNASYTVLRSRTKFGPLKDAVSTFHDTQYSDLHTRAEFCGTCHNVTHPDNGLVLEDTFGEWEKGPYAAKGVRCQDCHMSFGLTHFQKNPGKASRTGPDRENVSVHYFIGPNLIFKTGEDAAELRALSEKLLKSAAEVKITNLTKAKNGMILNVDVTNKGAGHSIPTGVTEIRDVWLEITAADKSGKVFFHSGARDEKGSIMHDPIPVQYHTWVKNQAGQFTTQFWNAVEITNDHRLPPQQTVTENIPIPSNGNGPITVHVKLLYRSVSPEGLAEVNAPGTIGAIPVFTMADDTRIFDF